MVYWCAPLVCCLSGRGMEMDGDPPGSKDAGVIEVLEITEECENGHAGLKVLP